MKPVTIIPIIVIQIIVATVFAVYFVQSMPQQNLEMSEEQEVAAWQLLQKTYLEQECRELYIGQTEELQNCFERIDEEQRLNPPTNPQESEPDCSIQCLVYDPVCGEDGITYACGVEDAACHGVKVGYAGECSDLTSSYMKKITPTLDEFQNTISEPFDIDTIFSKFGEPHRDIGSGIHIYVYELNDFTEIWIGYVNDILYVKQVDADGNQLEELFAKYSLTSSSGCPMPGDPPPRDGLPEGCPLPGHLPP